MKADGQESREVYSMEIYLRRGIAQVRDLLREAYWIKKANV
jgi:hypothetical protein